MTGAPSAHTATAHARPVARPQASRRDDAIIMLLASWLVVGLFIDGWAHNNLPSILGVS